MMNYSKSLLTMLLLICNLPSHAQGVVIHKKDGTKLKMPYRNIERIETYENTNIGPLVEGEKKSFTVNGVSFSMMPVKAGSYEMGSTIGGESEMPVHSVTISHDYYIGETEVTQILWKAVTGTIPQDWKATYGIDDMMPAYNITHDEVIFFLNRLNNMTGENFRLPTEAEWEYAARGGDKSHGYIYSGNDKLGEVAWYADNSNNKLHEVAKKNPNELGIYDMSGNVSEMCSDWYDEEYYSKSESIDPNGPIEPANKTATGIPLYVVRGGHFKNSANSNRCSNRVSMMINSKREYMGFRIVLVHTQ